MTRVAVCKTEKPCPRCVDGPMPTWGNVDQARYCEHHVGEIMREIAGNARVKTMGAG